MHIFNAIYIGRTQKTPKKRIEAHFSHVLSLVINGQKSDPFTDHYKKHFKYTIPIADPHMCMMFKIFNHIDTIRAIK